MVETNNYLYAADMMLAAGGTSPLNISLQNKRELVAFEFYLRLPDGFSLLPNAKRKLATLNAEREDGHSLTVNNEGNGVYHFLCYSNPLTPFIGNDGVLLQMTVQCDENTNVGVYEANIDMIKFSDVNKMAVAMADVKLTLTVPDVLPGDLTEDGIIDVMDIVELVDCIMKKQSTPKQLIAGDFDGNGVLDVMDIVEEVALIMSNKKGNANMVKDTRFLIPN